MRKGAGGEVSERVRNMGTQKKPNQGKSKGKHKSLLQKDLKELRGEEKRGKRKTASLKARLLQAGLPLSPSFYLIICALLFGGVTFFLLIFTQKFLISLGLGFALGVGLPFWVLGFLKGRREKKFARDFPNAVDIITRGMKAGLPLGECLQMVAREMDPPLSGEFQLLVDSESLGLTLEQGLERMFERVPSAEVNFFAIVLSIQRSTGGNLVETLENLSSLLRSRKLLSEKIKALSAEAKTSAYIIGVIPFLIGLALFFLSRDYIMLLFTTPVGNIATVGALIWMGLGLFVMTRMANFKF